MTKLVCECGSVASIEWEGEPLCVSCLYLADLGEAPKGYCPECECLTCRCVEYNLA